MTIVDDPKLSVVAGGHSVAENLQRAIDAGVVVLQKNGRLRMASPLPTPDDDATLVRYLQLMGHPGEVVQPCHFLNDFLFDHVYAQAAVPFGCRDCYKVKITTETPRQLAALVPLVRATGQTAKSGIETDTGNHESRFSTLFYSRGLAQARALYREMRTRMDADKRLGPGVAMTIKRGCSNYEAKLGPSDAYTFDPRLEAVEAKLFDLFRRKKMTFGDRMAARWRMFGQMLWVAGAYLRRAPERKPARPAIVSYPVDET